MNQPDAIRVGALIVYPGSRLIVAAIGAKLHSDGYGPVDFCAYSLFPSPRVGTIVSTPWGQCEIVPAPEPGNRAVWHSKKRERLELENVR